MDKFFFILFSLLLIKIRCIFFLFPADPRHLILGPLFLIDINSRRQMQQFWFYTYNKAFSQTGLKGGEREREKQKRTNTKIKFESALFVLYMQYIT